VPDLNAAVELLKEKKLYCYIDTINYNENINSLRISPQRKIFKKYEKFLNTQKKREDNILKKYNNSIFFTKTNPKLSPSEKEKQIPASFSNHTNH
jgi:hypothetical protein